MRIQSALLLAAAVLGLLVSFGRAAALVGGEFREVFASLPGGERDLPVATRVVLNLGQWFAEWWWTVAAPLAAVVAACIAVRSLRPRAGGSTIRTDP